MIIVRGDNNYVDNGYYWLFLFSQVKKAVGGQARGMALYEDDVRPSHGSHTTVYKILYRMTFL